MANVLNRVVAVSNWSFHNPILSNQARNLLAQNGVTVHYCQGDIDHQRTVTAFSGPQATVFDITVLLADLLLPQIDLSIQKGEHPRVGALDVCPFVLIEGNEKELIDHCRIWAHAFSSRFNIPTYLYEKAAFPGDEFRLPFLRGQMGKVPREPDFGKGHHHKWGTTIAGVRDFLLATNIDLQTPDVAISKKIAGQIRSERENGNQRLKGVRALGFSLKSRGLTQLSINMTRPDCTCFDDVFRFAQDLLVEYNVSVAGTELIGVIREKDLSGATYLRVDPEQVVV